MTSFEKMQHKSINRLLWEFSLPAIVGMTVNSLYNIVDRIFVGRGVGSLGIAATTVAFPIMIVFFAVSILIGVGATALISIRLGQRRIEEAEKVMGNATTMLVILPLILMVIYYLFAEKILIFFGASPDVLPHAYIYTNIIVLGSIFGSIALGMNNFIRADGSPRISMLSQIIGGCTNVGLNYIFTFKLGMGIAGLAWATIIGQLVSALFVLSYFLRGKSTIKIHLHNLKVEFKILLSILSIGFAPFGLQMANSVQQVILNKTLRFQGGDMALSAIGIIMSLATILFMPVVGLSQGAQPIIGYNYGAKEYRRVRETYKKAIAIGTVMVLIGYIAIHLWPSQLIGLFSEDQELLALTEPSMLVYFTMMPLLGFQIISTNYFQAIGKPVQSSILSLSRQILFFIPLLLILPNYWGINGVWRTPPISDILSTILTAVLILHEMKSLTKKDFIKEQSYTIEESSCNSLSSQEQLEN